MLTCSLSPERLLTSLLTFAGTSKSSARPKSLLLFQWWKILVHCAFSRFLPTFPFGRLAFDFQADWIVPASREDIDRSVPWNHHILERVPGLLAEGILSMQAQATAQTMVSVANLSFAFLPSSNSDLAFFNAVPAKVITLLRDQPCVLREDETWGVPERVVVCDNSSFMELIPSANLRELRV
eukprot:RCo037727